MITKEFIIEYLKEYYKRTNSIPRLINKEYPFSAGTILNRFGSINNALIEAGIPLFRNSQVEVNCKQCNIVLLCN